MITVVSESLRANRTKISSIETHYPSELRRIADLAKLEIHVRPNGFM